MAQAVYGHTVSDILSKCNKEIGRFGEFLVFDGDLALDSKYRIQLIARSVITS